MVVYIPRIIPNYRLLGTILALILSSAIFVGTNSIILTMNDVSQDFFGARDDVIVFYNTAAATPFTSRVSNIYVQSFESIDGVDLVSPEVFQPVVINEEAAYLRGANFSILEQVDEVTIIEGSYENNPYSAMIGSLLADRLALKVGSTATVGSIITSERMTIKISGIYESDFIASDELVIPIPTAQAIASLPQSKVTHIRIKYDQNHISEQEVLQLGSVPYNLDLDFDIGNATIDLQETIVSLKQDNKEIARQNLNETLKFSVIRGNYTLEVASERNVLYSRSLTIYDHLTSFIPIGQDHYNTELMFTSNGIPLQNYFYTIYDETDSIAGDGELDDGRAILNLLAGNFTVNLTAGLEVRSYEFEVSGPSFEQIELFDIKTLDYSGFINDSVLESGEFRMVLDGISATSEVYMNSTQIHIQRQDLFSDPYIDFDLTDGYYVLEFIEIDNPELREVFTFQVNTSLVYFSTHIQPYYHYQVAESIIVQVNGIRQDSIISNLVITTKENSSLTVEFPSESGMYHLYLEGQTFLNETISIFIPYFVENSPSNGGWIAGSPQPVISTNEKIALWTKSDITNTTTQHGQIIEQNNVIYYQPSMLTDGNYNDTVETASGNFELSFHYYNNYTTLFKFVNSSGTFDFGDLFSSNFTINYPSLSPQNLDQAYFRLEIIMDRISVEVYPNQTIYVPNTAQPEVGQLIVRNLLTNAELQFEFWFFDPFASEDIAELISLPTFIDDGILFLPSTIEDIEVSLEGTIYTPLSSYDDHIRLLPGNNRVNLYFDGGSNRTFFTFVPSWELGLLDLPDYLSTQYGFINTTSKSSISQLYLNNGEFVIKRTDGIPTMDVIKIVTNQSIQISWTHIVSGNLTIHDVSGQVIIDTAINSSHIKIQFPGNSVINITAEVFDGNGLKHLIQESIEISWDIVEASFQINYTDYDQESLIVDLHLIDTNTSIKYLVDTFNSTFTLDMLLQNVLVEITTTGGVILYSQIQYIDQPFAVSLGIREYQFYFFNKNYGRNETSVNVNFVNLDNSKTVNFVFNGDPVNLNPGNYDVVYRKNQFQGAITLTLAEKNSLRFEFDILNTSIEITVERFTPLVGFFLLLEHQVLNYVYSQQLISRTTAISIPVGEYMLNLSGTWGHELLPLSLLDLNAAIILEPFLDDNSLFPVVTDKIPVESTIGISPSDEYLDEFLQGALRIVQLILVAEVLIILIILFVNFLEIFGYVASESRQELRIMKLLGSNHNQLTVAYAKLIFILSPIIALIGMLTASLLVSILFSINRTVFFGHQFQPTVNSPVVIGLNFILVIGLVFASANIAIRRELNID